MAYSLNGGDVLMNSILVALNDSASSTAVVDYLVHLAIKPDQIRITLIHVLIKPAAGDELMGKKFMEEQPRRIQTFLNQTKIKLEQSGFLSENIDLKIVSESHTTVADGIIDQFHKEDYDLVVIGRKKMSKAQEFVLGDPSIRLVRALEGTAILVVKTK